MCEWSVPDWGGAAIPSPPPDNLYSPPQTVVRCEVQSDPLWAKMSTAGVNSKKRKKPETKPQSQLNKCLNEKRRRELENVFIEELAELISASFADMSSLSVKPDKCAILQETVNQIRHIKEQQASATIDAVQQGEVSSSKPTILANEVFGPLLLEALEGFLFVVNSEGKVEFVTENVSQFIKYSKEEVLGKSVYNILHHGDHTRFSSCLLPPAWGSLEGSTAQAGGAPPPRNRTFNCRFLVKPPDDNDQTMEEKQQRVCKYENMQISSTQLPQSVGGASSDNNDESGDMSHCLMCVARRIPLNEKHLSTPIEQFSMKLDTSGKIIAVDTTGISTSYTHFLNKDLLNRNLEELCHTSDLAKLSAHLKEALTVGQSTSPIYRLRVASQSTMQEKYVHVHTKSKLFKSSNSHEMDFIMATHSIIGENELPLPSLESCSSPVGIGGNSQSSTSSVGATLVANVNGSNTRGSVSSSEVANTITLSNSTAFQTVTLNSTDLDFTSFDMFPSSTWELGEERMWERPESRASLTPTQSPLAPAPTTPFTSTNFPFSPPLGEDKESDDMASSDSGRLRNLLMTKRTSTDSEPDGGTSNRNRNRILKGLLNQEEDEHASAEQPKQPNNMLLKLLNEKSDDDDVEARAGLKKQNELLQQLLKEEERNQESGTSSEEPLLKNFVFRSTSSPAESIGKGRKRPSSEDAPNMNQDETTRGPKRPTSVLDALPPATPVSSPGNSKLWEKNKMLATLLAKRPSTPTTIPPIPASVISATPQDKMPRIKQTNPQQGGWHGGSIQQNTNPVPSPGQVNQQQQVVQRQAGELSSRSQQAMYNQQQTWDDQSSSDPILSKILDQVIEFVPDPSDLMNMINSMEAQTSGQSGGPPFADQDLINEKMAIHAIQKSLMLDCESVNNNPVYNSNQPITTNQQTNQQQQQQQFPPPPVYHQRQRLPLQAQLRQAQYTTITNPQHHLMQQQLQQRSKILQQQQQQKQRLLQQQQQQQLLIPSNAAASSADPGIHNIDSLMTVAPNVSLQRSGSVPDSQHSPVNSYSSGGNNPNMIRSGSQISPGKRQPYSPQPFSPVNGGMNSFQNAGSGGSGSGGGSNQPATANPTGQGQQARLSPTSLQNFQQAQLSPRLSQAQQGFGSQTQSTTWSQQQANRLSLQQQQNPMLNAQLTGSNYSSGGVRTGFTPSTPPGSGGGGTGGVATVTQGGVNRGGLPPVRSLTSPGSRQSPFPPELSPTTAASYHRLQRSMSGPHPAPPPPQIPQATTHLPGGGRCIRPSYIGKDLQELQPYHHQPQQQQQHHHPHHTLIYPDQQYTGQYPGVEGYSLRPHPSGGNNGMTEYVRQELRAMVGARTGVTGSGVRQSGGGQQVTMSPHHQVTGLENLGISFDIQPQVGVSESPKMWSGMSDMGGASPQSASLASRSGLEEVNRPNDQKSSLLQKLLSE
ncbi:nuclear receptor coactivator 2-like isoform X1 [Cimex lectularius]|uniref:Nuclear receptor coactivator 2 n=1 Tax=Cimex lectularius TaxID=79782 RepID=A0A8I6RPB7_CIMLE|nr:nuclear receptor coactivator 2-like isoform X1 [Cimex lectularius]